ncbi:hypothetical protein G9P44_005975 [Scheffersomyces stipitis]|nr:hypothetical protein G9P44_005975 [Scheffersomyces stipitis]
MDESFHFALLRISIAQILKSHGFDKCKPSTLNIVTDLAIQYLKKLVLETISCSQTRTRSNNIEIQDITQALIMIEAIKPDDYLKLDDSKDSKYNTKSLDSFVNWVRFSDSDRVARELNEFPTALVRNLIDKRKLDLDDGETDQEKKKRKHKERQEYYNQLKLNEISNLHGEDYGEEEEEDEYSISTKDKFSWLNYLIEKDLKLGHDLKFLNSSLSAEFLKFQNDTKLHPVVNGSSNNEVGKRSQQLKHQLHNFNKYDYLVISIDNEKDENEDENGADLDVKPSDSLIRLLPYNLQYDKYLVDEDLDQYVEYMERHEMGAEEDTGHDEDNGHGVNDHVIDQEGDDDNLIIRDEGIGGENSLMLT